MSSSHFEAATATSADGDEQVHQARAHGGGMYALSNQVNMTNCYKRCEYFFKIYDCIHFKVLIACWIMAGYLGDHFRSVEEAYERGLDRLFDLLYKDKVLKLSEGDSNMIEFAVSSMNQKPNCRHPGFCFEEDVFKEVTGFGFYEEMSHVIKLVLSKDEVLSMKNGRASVLRWAHNVGSDKYLAAFNPSHDDFSLKALLENASSPIILLLRGFEELTLAPDSFPLHRLSPTHLAFLEISGSSRLTTIPDNTISRFDCLRYLNLSDLPIEEFPSKFFWSFIMLHCLILRGCYKLLSLDLGPGAIHCSVLDLSHCTALQNFVYPPFISWVSNFKVLDLSYTPFDHFQLISAQSDLSHLYLGGSKLEDFSFLLQSQSIKILDLSGCCCLTKLNEGLVTNLSNLQKLDLSWTKVRQLPSLAGLTLLRILSLRGLKLDSLKTLAPLSDRLVEHDLSGLKIISSSQLELELGFLQSFEKLQILNLSQTSVSELPDMSGLVSLKELLLADSQHLKAVPDLQSLTNLETLDLSLRNASSSKNLLAPSSFKVPKSIRKLVLTNRSGVQKLFPGTTLASLNLELLDLRGTDVMDVDCKLESQRPQERIPKPAEIHIVFFDDEFCLKTDQPAASYYFDHNEFIESLISAIQDNLSPAMAEEQLERLQNDLRYLEENYDRLKSSSNWKSGKELLEELVDAANNLSTAGSALDSASIKQLLQIVVKLKLLVPRKQIDESEALEATMPKKKKNPLFRKRESQENDVMAEIVRGMQEMEPDLLNAYDSLTTIQRNCLLCFSVFPYSEDRDKNTGLLKSLVIKKKILIYWWVGEGFIDPHPDQEMMIGREIEVRTEQATELSSATKVVKKRITVEDIGTQILNVLAEKGFIDPVMKKTS